MTGEFQLSLAGFDGPLADLPSLVARHQLALDVLPLAQIPLQFLGSTANVIDLDEAGEVLVAAANLLLLKSSQVLAEPVPELEPIAVTPRERAPDLDSHVSALRSREGVEALVGPGRLDLVAPHTEPRSVSLLAKSWEAMARREGSIKRTVVGGFLRLDVAIHDLLDGMRHGFVGLRQAVRGRGRRHAVTYFLGALELARRGDVELRQDGLFADIILVGRANDVGRRAG